MSDPGRLLLQIAVIIAAARATGALFRRIRQPEVLGEIVAGLLLGPSLLGWVSPRAIAWLFPRDGLGGLYAASQIGIVLFMFMVGCEVPLRRILSAARIVVVVSQASIVAPFLAGVWLAWHLHAPLGGNAPLLPFALFMGAAMSITAFPVLARILAERGVTNTPVGVLALSTAAVDDVTAWMLLAVITVIARQQGSLTMLGRSFAGLFAYLVLMFAVVRPVLARVLSKDEEPRHGRLAMILAVVMASAWATDALSVHALFGAFVAGLIMPRGRAFLAGLRGHMESLALVLLLPLFFAYSGLRTSVGLLNTPWLWLVCAVIILAAIGSKLLVSAAVLRASGVRWRESLAVGTLVNTRGLVELVILNVGLELGMLTPTLFSIMVLMALTTTFMTSPMLDLIAPDFDAGLHPIRGEPAPTSSGGRRPTEWLRLFEARTAQRDGAPPRRGREATASEDTKFSGRR